MYGRAALLTHNSSEVRTTRCQIVLELTSVVKAVELVVQSPLADCRNPNSCVSVPVYNCTEAHDNFG